MPQSASPDVRVSIPAPPAAPGFEVSPDQLKSLEALQDRAMKLELQLADLNVQLAQLTENRLQSTGAERDRLTKQMTGVQHDIAAGSIALRSLHEKINQLQAETAPSTAITLAPPPTPGRVLDGEQIMQIIGGAGMLMIPIVLVMARNLWIRGSRKRSAPAELEDSPRLQRMEQAIEAIAVEVERIGEAQRFSTKLLSDRPSAAPIPAARREPGTITPH